MTEARHHPGLAHEHAHHALVDASTSATDALDDDRLHEARCPFAARQIDDAHSAASQNANDAVAAEDGPADEVDPRIGHCRLLRYAGDSSAPSLRGCAMRMATASSSCGHAAGAPKRPIQRKVVPRRSLTEHPSTQRRRRDAVPGPGTDAAVGLAQVRRRAPRCRSRRAASSPAIVGHPPRTRSDACPRGPRRTRACGSTHSWRTSRRPRAECTKPPLGAFGQRKVRSGGCSDRGSCTAARRSRRSCATGGAAAAGVRCHAER